MKKLVRVFISGSASKDISKKLQKDCEYIAEQLAKKKDKIVLISGACTGVPHFLGKKFAEKGGLLIGFSPGKDLEEHVSFYGFPTEYFSALFFTGMHFGRNFLLANNADITIVINGRTGTLIEFSYSLDLGKNVVVYENSGNVAKHYKQVLKMVNKKPKAKVKGFKDVKSLCNYLLKLIDKEFEEKNS